MQEHAGLNAESKNVRFRFKYAMLKTLINKEELQDNVLQLFFSPD